MVIPVAQNTPERPHMSQSVGSVKGRSPCMELTVTDSGVDSPEHTNHVADGWRPKKRSRGVGPPFFRSRLRMASSELLSNISPSPLSQPVVCDALP